VVPVVGVFSVPDVVSRVTTTTPTAQLGGLTSLAAALLAGSLTGLPTSAGNVTAPGVPRAAAAPYAALAADAPTADPAAVTARLAGPLSDPALGDPAVFVVDSLTGQVLFDHSSTVPVAPASTLKTAVAAAALSMFDMLDTIRTRVVYDPADGGTLWLVGGGDPTLSAAPSAGPSSGPGTALAATESGAHLDELARQVTEAGITTVRAVVGDGSLFTGPRLAAGWRDNYVATGNVTPVTALSVDGGRSSPGAPGPRSNEPEAHAAGLFAQALRNVGVSVTTAGATTGGGVTTGGTGPAPQDAREVATDESAPIPSLVERMLLESDNDLAESLGRLVARERGQPTTFDGAARAVLDALRSLGVPTDGAELADVSGLSTANRIAPATLVALLRAAAAPERPELRTLLTSLPVAGFSGTLGDRYTTVEAAAGAGSVRAKTGSLRVVTSLAGQVVDVDGRLLMFALFAPVEEGATIRTALDRVAVALAGCGCPLTPPR
jgi:D-alanyl-D-alanine carboxypeptidase/D-alanyl-D-alanine-endopeptidase (penicillin-binding protein 4)